MTLGNGIVELITSVNRDKPNKSISRYRKLTKDTLLDTETEEDYLKKVKIQIRLNGQDL